MLTRNQSRNTPKKIIKVRRQGGVTLRAAPGATIGDIEVIDGEFFTIRSEAQLRQLIRQKKYDDVRRTCTSFIRNMKELFEDSLQFNEPIGHWDKNSQNMSPAWGSTRFTNEMVYNMYPS
jgi:hypothetical protein